ncbi:DUF2071 domain-containing protein [Flavitalea flava]
MFASLKNHPFAVEAFFKSSLVLTFAVPKEEIEQLIPECLQLDTFMDKWAFIAIAMVQTTGLRPKGFPRILGNDFFLIGYRVFVTYTTLAGKRLRGLYILKSETNKKKMEFLGNLFTHYNYTTTDIRQTNETGRSVIGSIKSGFVFDISTREATGDQDIPLPEHSPFSNWKEARRFAGPLPFTFTYEPETKKVLIIEGVRENWIPVPVNVNAWQASFLKSLQLNDVVLANAFIIKNIPYHWKKGRIELWKP